MERFKQVAELIRKRIDTGLIRPGDKLPSLRRLAEETGFSVVTVYKAYELLESQGICGSRDRSGFYALKPPKADFQRRSHAMPVMPPDNVRSLDDVFAPRVQLHAKATAVMFPGCPNISDAVLNKNFRRALLRTYPEATDLYDGDPELRNALVKRAARRGVLASQDRVVITRSAMEAFNLCLDSLSEPGFPILIESPSYYPILESLRHRQMKAIEIYSHPELGVDPGQFEHILKNTGVKLCVMSGTNRVPTGTTYDRETLKRIVHAAERNGTILIENDMTGELNYSALSAPTLKAFDSEGTVVQIGGTAPYVSSN